MRARSKKLREPNVRAPRGGAQNLLDLAWELDRSTPEEAWTHPWRSALAASRLCVRMIEHDGVNTAGPRVTGHVAGTTARALLGLTTVTYEEIQALRFSLQVSVQDAREARWLRTGCLILEAMLANSHGGGQLYGTLLWSARPDIELDGDRAARLLRDARVEDALGIGVARGTGVEAAFAEAWSAGRYRVAYLLASASRGVR